MKQNFIHILKITKGSYEVEQTSYMNTLKKFLKIVTELYQVKSGNQTGNISLFVLFYNIDCVWNA